VPSGYRQAAQSMAALTRALEADDAGDPPASDPVRLRSGWLNGIKRLPVSYA
jgi:hypothetical protein